MKNLLISIIVLSFSSFSLFANDMAGATVSATRPLDLDVDFQTSYFESKPWVKEFHYVVVVNKANSGKDAQTIKVYEYGNLIITGSVSTGRDEFEAAGVHNSKRDSWSVTPTGYYTPSFLDKNHKSGAYAGKWSWLVGGVKMPFAIFFNGDIALHQAPKGTESALGTKASGGCVRLPGEIASEIFARIEETQGSRIPKFRVDGTVEVDLKGHYAYSDAKFSALIIVKNKVLE
ncbi:MAG: L,D-transpeptidase [Bacteriovorax sp.]|nr:L,D-transpeptidase [Bacteriovorax sp.]